MKLVKENYGEKSKNQMSLISDTEEIIQFLEIAGKKSILNEHTVVCRLSACNNIFSILSEGENSVEYMLQNLDILTNRFRNKNTHVQPNTLKVYKSRLKSSLEDFQAWSRDPLDWEKSVMDKSNAFHAREKKTSPTQQVKTRTQTIPAPKPPTERQAVRKTTGDGGRKFNFPLRSDFNLEITLPENGLSLKDLLRIGMFLYPYCNDTENRDEGLSSPTLSN